MKYVMKKIVIIGATSGIGRALAECYAEQDTLIAVLGRRKKLLEELVATDPGKFIGRVCDITDTDQLVRSLDELFLQLDGIDLMVISAGTGELNPGVRYEQEAMTIDTNISGWTCAVDWTILRFEEQGFGHLAAISSVGGLRGSGVAPAYNASKAFQMNYLEGVRQRVNRSGKRIVVTDIRPGFVDTAMAKGEGLFWVASVKKVAAQVERAIRKEKSITYVTERWRWVAWALKLIPSAWYCRIGC